MNESLPPEPPVPPPAPAGVRPTEAAPARVEDLPGWERGTLEKLLFATLEEQRTARRWRTFTRLAWLAFFIFLIWAVSYRGAAGTDKAVPHTAVIEIQGEIGPKAEASAEFVIAAAKAAFEDDAARGVVLLINSPGGSPVQAGIISDELRRLRAKYQKPLYAVVEESCASAAYYIAVSADRIFVDKASIVGSIGVLMEGFGFVGLMDKLGVERRLLTAGANKGFLDPFSPQTDRHREHAQQMLDVVHRQFIDVVKTGRGKRLKDSPELFSGLFWTGQQAVELGLADQLGNLDFVAREVIKAEELVDDTRHENVAEKLAKRFGAAVGEGAVKALRAVQPMR
jgi:protease IV